MNNTGHVAGCQCMGCTGYGFHRYHLLRWLLGLFILVLVFALGVKLGEFKGFVEAGGWGSGPRMFYRTNGMMGGNVFYGQGQGWYSPMMQFAAPTTTPKSK